MKPLLKKALLVVVILLTLTFNAQAVGVWTVNQTITEILMASNDSVNIVASPMDGTSGCSNTGAYHIGTNDGNFKEKFTMLLSAYLSGKTVSLYVDGCTYGYAHIRNVKMK